MIDPRGSRKIASFTYVAGAEDGMTPLAADGYVAKLSLPPLLADALQRPVAAAVHTAGEQAAFGAVVTLVAHVTSVMDKKIVPSHQASPPSTGMTSSFVLTCNPPACRRTRTQGDSPACILPWSNRCPATPNHSCTRTTCCRSRGGTLAMEHSSAQTKVFFLEQDFEPFPQIVLHLACVAIVSCPAVTHVWLGAYSSTLLASLRALRVSAVIVRVLGQVGR